MSRVDELHALIEAVTEEIAHLRQQIAIKTWTVRQWQQERTSLMGAPPRGGEPKEHA